MAPKAAQFTLGTAILWLAGNDKKLRSYLKSTEKEIKASWKGLKASAKELNDGIMAAHDTLVKGMEIAAGVATGIAVAAAGAGVALFKLGMDAAAVDRRFNVTMGSMAEAGDKWAKDFSRSMMVGEDDLKETMLTFDLLLKNMGDSEQDALTKSEGLAKRSYDLAAFLGIPVADAQDKLQKAMAGQYRGLKELGVVINANALDERALAMGYGQSYSNLNQLNQAMVRYGEVMKQTTFADNGLKNNLDTNSRVVLSIRDGLKEIGETIGMTMQESGNSLLVWLRDKLWDIKKFIDDNSLRLETFFKWLSTAGGIVAEAMGTLAGAFGLDIGTAGFVNGMDSVTGALIDFCWWWWTTGRDTFEQWAADLKRHFDEVMQKISPMVNAIWEWGIAHRDLLLTLGEGLIVYPLVGKALGPLKDAFVLTAAGLSGLVSLVSLGHGLLKLFQVAAVAVGVASLELAAVIGVLTIGFAALGQQILTGNNFINRYMDSLPGWKWAVDDLSKSLYALGNAIMHPVETMRMMYAEFLRLVNFVSGAGSSLWGKIVNFGFSNPFGNPLGGGWGEPGGFNPYTPSSGAPDQSQTNNYNSVHAPININGASDPAAVGAAVQRVLVKLERERRGVGAGYAATF